MSISLGPQGDKMKTPMPRNSRSAVVNTVGKVVPTIAAASKILRTFLQKEHIPNFSDDVETNVIAAEIEEA